MYASAPLLLMKWFRQARPFVDERRTSKQSAHKAPVLRLPTGGTSRAAYSFRFTRLIFVCAACRAARNRLQDRDFAVGNTYSIVDPYLLVYFRWGNRMKLDMAGRFPSWTAHARRLETRPAVQRALAAEQVSLWA
jgi:glutathione S-transferase